MNVRTPHSCTLVTAQLTGDFCHEKNLTPPLLQMVRIYLHAAVSNNLGHDSVEGQLLVKGLDALVPWIVELPGAVKVQNVPEHFRVSVEEVFLRVLVVEKLLLRGAQQRVGIAIQRVLPCLDGEEELL